MKHLGCVAALRTCTDEKYPLRFGWLLVPGLYKEEYLQVFKCMSFDNTAFVVSGLVGVLINRFNHTSWVADFTPTDNPKSVRNRCVIEIFGGVCVLSLCFLEFSVGVRTFAIRLSQISSFLLFLICQSVTFYYLSA